MLKSGEPIENIAIHDSELNSEQNCDEETINSSMVIILPAKTQSSLILE